VRGLAGSQSHSSRLHFYDYRLLASNSHGAGGHKLQAPTSTLSERERLPTAPPADRRAARAARRRPRPPLPPAVPPRLTVATGALWIEQSALATLTSGSPDLAALAPIYLLVVAATVDAVGIARQSQQYLTVTTDGDLLTCPVCGNDVDPELDFCHWCTTDLDQFTVVPAGEAPPEPDRETE